MYVALDENGNRIYADDEQRYIKCFCPVCGKTLIHRKGTRKRTHFAHKQKSNCFMSVNKDYMSEWHIRMQSFFPKESREYRFQDKNTGEVHVADVYDADTNTVIEFQHSNIREEEYLSRTFFHLNNGRRIVWIFDESREKVNDGYRGRLKFDDFCTPNWRFRGVLLKWLYNERSFKWMYNPRKFLSLGPNIVEYSNRYGIFIYTGENENTVQRVIHEEFGFEYVTLSIGDIEMKNGMSTNIFFQSERSLLLKNPWKELIEDRAQEIREIKESENDIRMALRIKDRKSKGLNTDLSKCPLCGGELILRTATKGYFTGQMFYGCNNYPNCKFIEHYYDSREFYI